MAGMGGAVKLRGESEYRRALEQITQNLREVSSEMKAVSSSYDKNDTSTAALNAKTQALNNTLDVQKTKLSTLQAQYTSFKAKVEEQNAAHEKAVQKYNDEKAKLEQIGKTLGTTSEEYKKQQEAVDEQAAVVKKSTQAQDANAKSMSNMRIQINNTQADINKTTKELDSLGNEAEDSGKKAEQAANGGFTVMKGILANLGAQAITTCINGLKNLGATIVNTGKQAMQGYADYEQLEGGVKKLFGDDVAQTVAANANKAFSSAGMSANQYMETVTGFSASLISGLHGDTAKAAEISDMAIRDMADNANTFGTDMASIQYAYQGFAKQNYTMLDNLKLGYGGTQAEMARLINDSGVLGDSITVTAETVKDVPFDQVIQSINVIQQRMGITGTTAKEASMTISGSVGSMQSAWQNMLTGMANENANFEQLATNFIGTLITPDGQGGIIGTIVPRIATVITGMASALATTLPPLIQSVVPIIQQNLPIIMEAVQSTLTTILSVLPQVLPVIADLIPQIVTTLVALLPQIIDTGIKVLLSLIDGIVAALPQLIEMLPTIVTDIVTVLMDNIDLIIDAGIKILIALIEGITNALPQLIDMMPVIISKVFNTIINNLPKILNAGVKLLFALINGIIQSIPNLIAAVPSLIVAIVSTLIANLPQILSTGGQIIGSLISGIAGMIGSVGTAIGNIATTIIDGVRALPGQMVTWGKDMIQGLIDGIKGMIGSVGNAVSGVADKITSFLHFSRPDVGPLRDYETWMPDMVEGLSASLDKASPALINQTKALASGMSEALQVNGNVTGANVQTGYYNAIEAFKTALSQVQIVMDDEEMGHFVDKTVTRLVYT